MANLRIQVEIQKGTIGVPLEKLSKIVGDVQRFLSMLSDDVSLEQAADWIGLDFENGSLTFTAEKVEPATPAQIQDFNTAFISIAERHPVATVRRATIVQYAKIADPIEAEEAVSFSLFEAAPESDVPYEEWDEDLEDSEAEYSEDIAEPLRRLELTRSEAVAIQAEVQSTVRAYGALQGRIHSLFLASHPAHFQLRELSTGTLVKCVYTPEIYPQIAAALRIRNAVLHVYGYTSTDLVERKVEEMQVSRVDPAPTVNAEEFEALFGSAPHFTGRLTTQEFINYARGRGQ